MGCQNGPAQAMLFGTMADLKIAPAHESSNTPAVLLALAILAAIAGAIFYFNPHKIAELKVTSVDTYSPKTTFTAMEGAGAGNGTHVLDAPTTSTEDDLYVVAHVSMTDKLRLPLFLTGAVAHVKFADGSEMDSNLLSASDLKRLGVIFPDIRREAQDPISDGDTIQPGQTLKGSLVLPFPGQTADAWHSKKQATLTLQLRNQGPQMTILP